MNSIVRHVALLLMIGLVALSLGGCMDYSAVVPELEADLNQPEATQLPPLTEALIESRDDFYRYYNQVSLADKMDDLRSRFPGATVETGEAENTYSFIFDDGFGFSVVFDEGGAMRGKIPFYKDIRQLKPIAPGKGFDQVGLLSSGQTYATVSSLFGGRGLEIMQMPPESAEAEGVRRLYIWIAEDNSTAEVLFDETGAYVSLNIGNIG